MNTPSVSLISPTGALGMGFPDETLERGIVLQPDFIACDAGSTDSGPFYLGASKPKLSRRAVLHDLRRLLRARQELGVPLVIGSCGTSGTDDGVNWVREMVLESAKEEGMSLKLGLIYSEQKPQKIAEAFKKDMVQSLPGAPSIDRESILKCSHIVAMMGHEPIVKALEEGCDVVLCGRASDTALFAAYPMMKGIAPGPVWHCGKTVECGAVCTTLPASGGVFAKIDDSGFSVEPLSEEAACTPMSLAAHTLYENADPNLFREPSGTLDTTNSSYHAINNRVTRVEGSVFHPERYTLKLEGSAFRGYQTVAIGGIRDPFIIRGVDAWRDGMMEHFKQRVQELTGFEVGREVNIEISFYGRDAVMGKTEPMQDQSAHELGILFTVTAPEQSVATDIARFVTHAGSHWSIPEWKGFISGIAFPFSPPEIERGPAYRFMLNHVLVPDSLFDPFRFSLEEVW